MSATSLWPFSERKYPAILAKHFVAVSILLCVVTGPAVVDCRRYLASANSSLAQSLPQVALSGRDTGVDAARQVLHFLLGPTLAANKSILDTFMPPVEPCQPSSPITSEAQGTPSPDLAPGTCGPQPALPTFASYGYPISPNAESVELPQLPACSWSWLSCTDGRVVAMNLSCPGGSSTCTTVPLRGSLPPNVSFFPSLVSLDLSGNANLTGSLAMLYEIEPYRSLKILNLSGCGLSGSIPDYWKAVPGLQMLDLSGNRLTGTIPSFSGLHNLSVLSLGSNNDLWGPVPSQWSELRQLKVLDLRGLCRLCGSTSTFTSLIIKLTQGSHVDQSCRLDECRNDSKTQSRLKGAFQGVMAALASVLGLIALYLMVRRVRHHADLRRAMRRAGGSYEDRERIRRIAAEVAQLGPEGARIRAYNRLNRCQAVLRAVPMFIVEFGVDADSDTWSCSVAGPSDLLWRASVWLSQQWHLAEEPLQSHADGSPTGQQQEWGFSSVLVASDVGLTESSRPGQQQDVAGPVVAADSGSGSYNAQIAEVGGAAARVRSSRITPIEAVGGSNVVAIREVVWQHPAEEAAASSGGGVPTSRSVHVANVEVPSELLPAANEVMDVRHSLMHYRNHHQQGLSRGVVQLATRSGRIARASVSMPDGVPEDDDGNRSNSAAEGGSSGSDDTATQGGLSIIAADSNVGLAGAALRTAPSLAAVSMMIFPEELTATAAAVVSSQHQHDGLPKLTGMQQLLLSLHAHGPDAVVLMPDGVEVCLGLQVSCDNSNSNSITGGITLEEEKRGVVEDTAAA